MTDQGYIHYIAIADRSGSVGSIPGFRVEMENGINKFIKDRLNDPGRATITLHQFDTEQETLFSFVPVADAPRYELHPRGGTALRDAIGITFTSEGQKLAGMPEDQRPHKVVVLIATDGLENSSQEYTGDQVVSMITEQREKYGWEVIYIGANQDAVEVGGQMGVAMASAATFASSASGVRSAFNSTSDMATRGSAGGAYAYTTEERGSMLKPGESA